MIESEAKASLILKDLEKISSEIANLERFLIKEDEKLSEALCRIIADIFWRIEHPIIREYPSLCSLVVIGERYKECTYRIVRSDRNAFTCSVLKSEILPENAARVLSEIENSHPKNQNVHFYLEVESCTPPQELF